MLVHKLALNLTLQTLITSIINNINKFSINIHRSFETVFYTVINLLISQRKIY